ncbi:MAG TPA: hypothetical protein DGT21_20075 [Armatimonadetes bacterium]|nr:hypothetical protein [Armatimonadota bacterium]
MTAPLCAVRMAIVCIGVCAAARVCHAGEFVDLGVPVRHAQVMNAMVGPDAEGHDTQVYALMLSAGKLFFLLQIDAQTGEVNQYEGAEGFGAWHSIVGPDDRIYVAAYGGEKGCSLWVFDPAQAEQGLHHEVDWAPGETICWKLAADEDTIYGCTYGHATVPAYNTRTGEIKQYGGFTPTGQYARPVFVGAEGWVYTAVGTAEWDMIALNPRTGEFHSVRTPEQKQGPMLPPGHDAWGRMFPGQDGHIYYWDNDGWHRLVGGKSIAVADSELPAWYKRPLTDGRVLGVFSDSGYYTLVDRASSQITRYEFEYQAPGSTLFMVAAGPDGAIYGSSIIPLQMFRHDPRTGENTKLGNPTRVGGEIYSILPHGQQMVIAAYPGAYLSVYDPAKPWIFGTEPESNPRGYGQLGDGHHRPQAMIAGPEGRVYVGSIPDYGQLGGAMGVFDLERWELVENYRNLIPAQSIPALAYDPVTGLVFGGTSIHGGGGSTPTAKEALIYAWDPAAKEIVWQTVPVPGSQGVTGLTLAGGKLFASVRGNSICALDPATGELLSTGTVPRGWVHYAAIGTHSDGMVYGLTGECIYRVDPATYEITEVAAPDTSIKCGFALTDDGVYFGSGTNLWLYRW